MLTPALEKSLSKLMSLMLRHQPETFGLLLDPEDGSCPVEDLVQAFQAQPKWAWVTQAEVGQVVRSSDKQRFALADGRIRARYGHSHDKVSYAAAEPPAVLYHGTGRQTLPAILKEGLRPMGRQYVHLSASTSFAALAGGRKGELALLRIDTVHATALGVVFYYAGNEVWLADQVPPSCCAAWEAGSLD